MKKLILILLLLPSTAQALELGFASPREVCRRRLQDFVEVMVHFKHVLGETSGIMPDLEDVYLYFKKSEALLCPLDKEPIAVKNHKSLRTSFLRYENYQDAQEAKVYPSRIPLYFDRAPWRGKGRFVVFADGLLRWLKEEEFQKILSDVDDQVRIHKTKTFAAYLRRLEKNAQLGDVVSMSALGDVYQRGFGVKKDLTKARQWYEKAAEKKEVHAMLALGSILRTRENSEELVSACNWFKQAAETGSREGQFNLGVCYAKGGFGKINEVLAFAMYRESAYQGYPPAQFNLAVCYAQGKGEETDLEHAYTWMYLATQQGEANAIENLPILRRSLDDGNIYEAENYAGMLRSSFWPEENEPN